MNFLCRRRKAQAERTPVAPPKAASHADAEQRERLAEAGWGNEAGY